MNWPPKPELSPEVLAELEKRGVDAVRAMLASGKIGYWHRSTFPLWAATENPTANPSRLQVEAWLNWKVAGTESVDQG